MYLANKAKGIVARIQGLGKDRRGPGARKCSGSPLCAGGTVRSHCKELVAGGCEDARRL